MSTHSMKNNPPTRFPNSSILDSEGTWWIAKLKPRQEKAFAFDLLKREIEYYLPLYTKTKLRSDGKKVKSFLVLFPSYVPFVSENPYQLLQLNRIVKILKVNAQERFKKQLQQVFDANENDTILTPVSQHDLKIGNEVKIINGPMNGIVGNIIDYYGYDSLVLKVDGMGCVKISTKSFQVQIVV